LPKHGEARVENRCSDPIRADINDVVRLFSIASA
jgi:hypothetical protein